MRRLAESLDTRLLGVHAAVARRMAMSVRSLNRRFREQIPARPRA